MNLKINTGEFFTIKTDLLQPPKIDLLSVLDTNIQNLKNGDIIFITTKIISLHQGRCIPQKNNSKEDLAKLNSTYFLGKDNNSPYPMVLTITENCLIPYAGIDESNANGYFILWPINIGDTIQEIRKFLMRKYSLEDLGIVATDTRSNLLQKGCSGLAVACAGFEPLISYEDDKDLFDRPFVATRVNVAQCLANMAVFLMGEGNQQTPIAVYRPSLVGKYVKKESHCNVKYVDNNTTDQMVMENIEDDIYIPILKPFFTK